MMSKYLAIFCGTLMVGQIVGYSSGPPISVCNGGLPLFPGHGPAAQAAGTSPYSIVISGTEYTPGGTLDSMYNFLYYMR